MYPMLLNPIYKEIVWGGKLLREKYGKTIISDQTGESWEIAAHKNGSSIIRNGAYTGKTLLELVNEQPSLIYGNKQQFNRFPLLFKLIDANQDLSVQVHPDDEMAKILETGDIGKTEAWYVLENRNPEGLVAGLVKGTDAETFALGIKNGTVESLLTKQAVVAGDVINIPAGIVHAINSGLLVAEIQQTSDTTFRVYDYNRLGLDGKPRELHVTEALQSIKFDENGETFLIQGEVVNHQGYTLKSFVSNEYFALEELTLHHNYDKKDNTQLMLYFVLEGTLEIEASELTYKASMGDSFIIPGSLDAFKFNGTCKLLQMYVPFSI